MAIPVSYNVRNLIVRKATTLMTAAGIAMTVAVLLGVMGLVSGLRSALEATGDPLHVLVMRKGGNAELTSLLTQQQFQIVKSFPGIAVGRDGQPMASLEVVTIVNLPTEAHPEGENVTLRGLPPRGIEMRNLKLASGRWFQPGQREVVAGKSIANRYPNVQIGKQLRFGKGYWTVVGVMDAGRSAVNSEIFADSNQVASDFNRSDTLSSALLQATDEVTAGALKTSLESDRRLNVTVMSEKDYYALQTVSATPIRFLGIFVCIIMAVGSCFAAMNTMYAAVARRAKEVGTLRVLGFSRGSILLSFLFESLLLSLIGGVIACLVVLPLNSVTTGLGNFMTFSETSFNFRIGPEVMAAGVLFALVLGAIGGLLPARQAAKKEILTALREI
ncbi:MAG: ABC transporter permease [Acidobacteriaceae bacterium]|nr:ABC transporter permease [Acidobacteriaceae bacterium]MBV9780308.1 ABC transporter permease [Acidobacteriaceae bacterium]